MSCSRIQTINLKEHSFGRTPDTIIWLQIAGLQEEHFALLRFNLQASNKMTSFEKSTCLGKAWAFNLYDLRPKVKSSFVSQMVGSNNIKSTCQDYKQDPFWKIDKDEAYSVGIFEMGVDKRNSVLESQQCPERSSSWNDPVYWVMRPPGVNKKTFHYQEKIQLDKGGVYFDKSCKANICFASPFVNVKKIWNKFSSNSGKKVFILRDETYLKALMKKDISSAREMLGELEKIHSWFNQKLGNKSNTLILVTSAKVRDFEFPRNGKEWAEFEKSGKHVIYRNSSLLSPVFASGASSENFCGIFNENEIGKRFFWVPKRKRFDLFNF
ncbi:MAG: hypothetical protein KC493_02230 [Bacteriovoracaceae bacterium]|nr:hypothetical protein [Bacteriovoracaceae bacterium]